MGIDAIQPPCHCSVADEPALAYRAPSDDDQHQQPELWTFLLALKLRSGATSEEALPSRKVCLDNVIAAFDAAHTGAPSKVPV